MRNVNKSPKIPYSAMVREVESDPEQCTHYVAIHCPH